MLVLPCQGPILVCSVPLQETCCRSYYEKNTQTKNQHLLSIMAFIARTGCGRLWRKENFSGISYNCSHHQDVVGYPGHQMPAAESRKGLCGVHYLGLLLVPLSIKAARVRGVFMPVSWPRVSSLHLKLSLQLSSSWFVAMWGVLEDVSIFCLV